ncbi:hypothetical protein HZA41_02940 [Candidatus Peregrinibacteria bacterium]|nr:hypothetical protein [Candidatus Peregrinibacteria bacterium]
MDKITKFLQTLRKDERRLILAVLDDVRILRLDGLDVLALSGYKDIFRVRKSRFRIIFSKKDGRGYLLEVNYRKDAYKRF